MGIIKVRGYAEKYVEADVVKFTIRFTDSFTDIGEVIEKVNKNCELFLEKIKDHINIEDIHLDEDESRTSYYQAKIKNYNRVIYFTTKASPKINNIVNDIVKQNGIVCTIDTEYIVSNLKEVHNELLELAVKDAVNQANIIAAASSTRVSGVDNISYERENNYDIDTQIKCRYIVEEDSSCYCSNNLKNKEELESEEVFVTFNIM